MIRKALVLAALPIVLAGASFGGWATITVEELPDYFVAGGTNTLRFTIRQHGRNLLPDLQPRLEARSGSSVVRANATGGPDEGHYRVAFVLPRKGEWTVTIQSGFGPSRTTLDPITAIDPGGTPVALSDADRGRRLFVAKGCATCHEHRGVKRSEDFSVGPELTERRYPAHELARILADPSAMGRSRQSDAATWQMPNLHLKQNEIAALVAFINAGTAERQASR